MTEEIQNLETKTKKGLLKKMITWGVIGMSTYMIGRGQEAYDRWFYRTANEVVMAHAKINDYHMKEGTSSNFYDYITIPVKNPETKEITPYEINIHTKEVVGIRREDGGAYFHWHEKIGKDTYGTWEEIKEWLDRSYELGKKDANQFIDKLKDYYQEHIGGKDEPMAPHQKDN